MTAEERARTLTGRHQISEDGRHLVDGIPFGRPYLRNPSRPAVRIPPRKRQRLNEPDEEVNEALMLTEASEVSPTRALALLTNGDTTAGSGRSSRAQAASKAVRFGGFEVADDQDSDEDDEDFDPDGVQAKAAVTDEDEEDDSDFDSDSDSDSSSASGSSSSDSDSDDSSSDSDSASDASSPPEVLSSKGLPKAVDKATILTPPGRGKPTTHSRNSRRTRTNRLRHLKETGKLPADADLKALAEYEAGQVQEPSDSVTAIPFSTYNGKRKRVDDDVTEDTAEDSKELEQRKQELMARLSQDQAPTPAVVSERKQSPPADSKEPIEPAETADELTPEKKETPKKRLRPDTGAIGRILARQAMVCTPRALSTYTILILF